MATTNQSKFGVVAPALNPAIQRGQGFTVNTVELPEQASALSEALQTIARNYIGARRRSGEALLEAARWLHEARQVAQHGEWGTFLEATSTSNDTAERLINIHLQAAQNPQFADAVARNWLSQSAAALLARPSTPPEVISEVLEAEQPPTTKDIQSKITAVQNPQIAEFETERDLPPTFQAQRERAKRLGFDDIHVVRRANGNDYLLLRDSKPYATTNWTLTVECLDRFEDMQQPRPSLTSAEITDRLATQTREANRGNPSWQYTHDDPDPDDSSVYVADMRPSIVRPDLDQFAPERAAIHRQTRQALLSELDMLAPRTLRLLAFAMARGGSDEDIALNNPSGDLLDQIATCIAERIWNYGAAAQRASLLRVLEEE